MLDFSQYKPLMSRIEENQARQYTIDRQRQIDEERRQQAIFENEMANKAMAMREREFGLREKNLESGGNIPAALRLANEYQSAIDSGDINRANAIAQFAKTVDRNVELSQQGQYIPRAGLLESAQQMEYAKNVGRITGKEQGENVALLQDVKAYMPKLEETTKKLSSLGKLATYTMAGQTRDSLIRQLGFEVPDAAVARAEYISTVDNEILPLLRQTFGAAFTQKEGESLRATLGDPNKSPNEKDAVLRAFINNKRTQIDALQRRTGSSLYQQSEQEFNNRKQGNIDPLGIR